MVKGKRRAVDQEGKDRARGHTARGTQGRGKPGFGRVAGEDQKGCPGPQEPLKSTFLAAQLPSPPTHGSLWCLPLPLADLPESTCQGTGAGHIDQSSIKRGGADPLFKAPTSVPP